MARPILIGAVVACTATLSCPPQGLAQSADTAFGGIVGGAIGNAIILRQNPGQSATPRVAPQPSRPGAAIRETVRRDQADLRALGFNTGRPDGVAGRLTRHA
ncbi:MAG: hypothetical protein AAGC86_08770 [Pseudomonadota bacterium]